MSDYINPEHEMDIRPRRNRKSQTIRTILQENHLRIEDMVAPFFLLEGKGKVEPIEMLPGQSRFSLDTFLKEVELIHKRGIQSVAIFPALDKSKKTADAREALNPNGLIPTAVRALKEQFPSLCVITDVALDPFTDHGHDGLVNEKGEIDNDLSLDVLVKQALVEAEAGVDIIAPSDMMDGRVKAIRQALEINGFTNTSILSYTAKYASALYGPFREAIKVDLAFGDKQTYQLGPANIREAMLETRLDIEEGADMIMVKPATYYLDVISKIYQETDIPVGAYHVTGEYAMVAAAAERGMLDKHKVLNEALLSIKRAGASFIFTYAYKDMLDLYGL